MKKKKTQDQERKRRSRRLGLSRETVRILDPALHLARGGVTETCTITTNDTGSNNANNCYPTNCSYGTTTTGPRNTEP